MYPIKGIANNDPPSRNSSELPPTQVEAERQSCRNEQREHALVKRQAARENRRWMMR